MTPNGDDGSGFVVGAFYTDKEPPPAQDENISTICFSDGTRIEYDKGRHALNVSGAQTINISGKTIRMSGDTVYITGEVHINELVE